MGAKVGFFLTTEGTDPDSGNVLTYKIIEPRDDDGKFALDIVSGQVFVSRAGAWVSRTDKPLDYETENVYNLTIEVTDQNGLKNEGPLTVNLIDVNEPASFAPCSRVIMENEPEGSQINVTLQSVDEDVGVYAVPTYTLQEQQGCIGTSCETLGDKLFEVEPTTGLVYLLRAYENDGTYSLDYEMGSKAGSSAKRTFRLRARSTDVGGAFGEAIVTVHVLDKDEAPVFWPSDGSGARGYGDYYTSRSSVFVYEGEDGSKKQIYGAVLDENTAVDVEVGRIVADQIDIGDEINYRIVAGNGDGLFKLQTVMDPDGYTKICKILVAKNMIDHEKDETHLLVIEAADIGTSDAAPLTDEAEFRVYVKDINEAPVFIKDFAGAVLENAPRGEHVGDPVQGRDEDQVVSEGKVEFWATPFAKVNDDTTKCMMQAGSASFTRAARNGMIKNTRIDVGTALTVGWVDDITEKLVVSDSQHAFVRSLGKAPKGSQLKRAYSYMGCFIDGSKTTLMSEVISPTDDQYCAFGGWTHAAPAGGEKHSVTKDAHASKRTSAGDKTPAGDEWSAATCQDACEKELTCTIAVYVRKATADDDCFLQTGVCDTKMGYDGAHDIYSFQITQRSDAVMKSLEMNAKVGRTVLEAATYDRTDAVGDCATAASKLGLLVFGVTDGGECVADVNQQVPFDGSEYPKGNLVADGKNFTASDICAQGKGNYGGAVSIYRLSEPEPEAPDSCQQILKNAPDSPSGVYTLNGNVDVYCDMTTVGGGWTLVAYGPKGHFGSLKDATGVLNQKDRANGAANYVMENAERLFSDMSEVAVAWTSAEGKAAAGGIDSFEAAATWPVYSADEVDDETGEPLESMADVGETKFVDPKTQVSVASLAASAGAASELDLLYPGVKYASNRGAYKIKDFNQYKYGGSVFLRGDNDKSHTGTVAFTLEAAATVYVAIDDRAAGAASRAPAGFELEKEASVTEMLTFTHGTDELKWPVYKKTYASGGDVSFQFKATCMAAVFVRFEAARCSDASYIKTQVMCIKGDCKLPETMYTKKGSMLAGDDGATYGLVAPVTFKVDSMAGASGDDAAVEVDAMVKGVRFASNREKSVNLKAFNEDKYAGSTYLRGDALMSPEKDVELTVSGASTLFVAVDNRIDLSTQVTSPKVGGVASEIDTLTPGVKYASNRGAYKIKSFDQDKYGGSVYLRGDNDKAGTTTFTLEEDATVYVAVDNRVDVTDLVSVEDYFGDSAELEVLSQGVKYASNRGPYKIRDYDTKTYGGSVFLRGPNDKKAGEKIKFTLKKPARVYFAFDGRYLPGDAAVWTGRPEGFEAMAPSCSDTGGLTIQSQGGVNCTAPYADTLMTPDQCQMAAKVMGKAWGGAVSLGDHVLGCIETESDAAEGTGTGNVFWNLGGTNDKCDPNPWSRKFTDEQMCTNGKWYPSAYAYKPDADGKPKGGTTPGPQISSEDALASLPYCVEALKNDPNCEPSLIGVADNNGHCWCVTKGDKCTETYKHQWQFSLSKDACQNGGTCSNAGGGFTCDCPVGFAGQHCETKLKCSSTTTDALKVSNCKWVNIQKRYNRNGNRDRNGYPAGNVNTGQEDKFSRFRVGHHETNIRMSCKLDGEYDIKEITWSQPAAGATGCGGSSLGTVLKVGVGNGENTFSKSFAASGASGTVTKSFGKGKYIMVELHTGTGCSDAVTAMQTLTATAKTALTKEDCEPDVNPWKRKFDDEQMCKNGRWYPSAYAYKPGADGLPKGGATPGPQISSEDALASLQYCIDAMKDDDTCDKDLIGVADNNGHCWCVQKGDKCTETYTHQWQFETYASSAAAKKAGLRLKGLKMCSHGPKYTHPTLGKGISGGEPSVMTVEGDRCTSAGLETGIKTADACQGAAEDMGTNWGGSRAWDNYAPGCVEGNNGGSSASKPFVCLANAETGYCNCPAPGNVYYCRRFASGKPGSGRRATFEECKASGHVKRAAGGNRYEGGNGEHGDPLRGVYKGYWCEPSTRNAGSGSGTLYWNTAGTYDKSRQFGYSACTAKKNDVGPMVWGCPWSGDEMQKMCDASAEVRANCEKSCDLCKPEKVVSSDMTFSHGTDSVDFPVFYKDYDAGSHEFTLDVKGTSATVKYALVRVGEHPVVTKAAKSGCVDLADPTACKAACTADDSCNEVWAYDNGRCCMKESSETGAGATWRKIPAGSYFRKEKNTPVELNAAASSMMGFAFVQFKDTKAVTNGALEVLEAGAEARAPEGFERVGTDTVTFTHGNDELQWPIFKKEYKKGDEVSFAFKESSMAATFVKFKDVQRVGGDDKFTEIKLAGAEKRVPEGFERDGDEFVTVKDGSSEFRWPVYKKRLPTAGDAKFKVRTAEGDAATMAAVWVQPDTETTSTGRRLATGDTDYLCGGGWSFASKDDRALSGALLFGGDGRDTIREDRVGVRNMEGTRTAPSVMSVWVRNPEVLKTQLPPAKQADSRDLVWSVGGSSDGKFPRVAIVNLGKHKRAAKPETEYPEMTVAFWFNHPDVGSKSGNTPFSYAESRKSNNRFLVYDVDRPTAYVGSFQARSRTGYADGRWHHVCMTWKAEGDDGKGEMYVDGELVSLPGKGSHFSKIMRADGAAVLGQEQDKVGGGFSNAQAYEGRLNRLNVFDRYMTAEDCAEVQRDVCAFADRTKCGGNVLSWDDVVSGVEDALDVPEADRASCGSYVQVGARDLHCGRRRQSRARMPTACAGSATARSTRATSWQCWTQAAARASSSRRRRHSMPVKRAALKICCSASTAKRVPATSRVRTSPCRLPTSRARLCSRSPTMRLRTGPKCAAASSCSA